jgi:hypothetical protein
MACLNCRTLVDLMHREIEELREKEMQMQAVHHTLKAAAEQVQSHGKEYWRKRYEQQVTRQGELQNKNGLEHVSPIVSKRDTPSHSPSQQRKSCSLRSVQQMDRLMSSLQQKWHRRTLSRPSSPF